MDLKDAFRILELDQGASISEVKQSYRNLALIWHPDRTPQNDPVYGKSLEKMKKLNAAYAVIRSYRLLGTHGERDAEPGAVGRKKPIFKYCPNCGAKNRVIQSSANAILRCGRCAHNLFDHAPETSDNEWGRKTLCGDGECLGIIWDQGRCDVCGRTFEEGREVEERRESLRKEASQKEIDRLKKRRAIRYSIIGFGIAALVSLALVSLSLRAPEG